MSEHVRPLPPPTLPRWRRGLAYGGAALLGAVFLVAAFAKLIDPVAFADQIRDEGLAVVLPAKTVAQLAIGLEVGLGLALLLGLRSRTVLLLTTALVAFFLFLTGRAWLYDAMGWKRETSSCGCFGSLLQRTPQEAFVQDFLVFVPATVLAWSAPFRTAGPPMRRIAASLLATAGAVVFAVLAPSLPLDDLATHLKRGARVDQICPAEEQKCLRDAIPPLGEGHHVVVLTHLDEPEFLAQLEALNAYAADGQGPRLWVLTAADKETVTMFPFTSGASFPITPTEKAIVRPLYRRLPRSFRVVDGVVREIWDGLPPLRSLSGGPPGSPPG